MKLLGYHKKSVNVEALTSILLLVATITALFIYNSPLKSIYIYLLDDIYIVKDFSIHMFINEFLMSIFFLVAGLDIKHEILYGNLSSFNSHKPVKSRGKRRAECVNVLFCVILRKAYTQRGICIRRSESKGNKSSAWSF